jgi:hypothetical protein
VRSRTALGTGVRARPSSAKALMFTVEVAPKEPSGRERPASCATRFVRAEIRAGSRPAAWAKRIVLA